MQEFFNTGLYKIFEPKYKDIIGKPFITVSAKGISNGLSNIPNDGADFGPDTQLSLVLTNTSKTTGPPYSVSNGIMEAIAYAHYSGINTVVILDGSFTINPATYSIGSTNYANYGLGIFDNMTILGQGIGKTTLNFVGSNFSDFIMPIEPGFSGSYCDIGNFTINAQNASQGSVNNACMSNAFAQYSKYHDMQYLNFSGYGWNVGAGNATYYNHYERFIFNSSRNGQDALGGGFIHESTFRDIQFLQSNFDGLSLGMVYDSMFENIYATNCQSGGFTIDGGWVGNTINNIIVDNAVNNSSASDLTDGGIILNDTLLNSLSENNSFTNLISMNNKYGLGIYLNSSGYNTFKNIISYNNQNRGINIEASNLIIDGMYLVDNNNTGMTYSGGNNNTISNVLIYDDLTTHVQTIGIYIYGPAGPFNNVLFSSFNIPNFAGLTSLDGQGSPLYVTIKDSYIPGMSFSTPAVPASGTALQNENVIPIKIYLYGGTVTQIQLTKNGTAYTVFSNASGLALSGQSYILNPGDSITLTYTAAPTWVWLPDDTNIL